MLSEVVIVVIIQAAPTAWISPPKFEPRVATQIARNVGFFSGVSSDAGGGDSSSRPDPPSRRHSTRSADGRQPPRPGHFVGPWSDAAGAPAV
jgi:hypothetical protein